jgi:hypothetical protein
MNLWQKFVFSALVACFWPFPFSGQCGFSVKPIEDVKWYREAGWPTPGVADAKSVSKVERNINGVPFVWPEGLTVSAIVHRHNYQVLFPAAIFFDNGVHKRMLPSVFQLGQLLRWEMNGKIYAYSYLIEPHDLLCFTTVDLIDDKGDGKFRVMISPGHLTIGPNPVPPPIPEWLKKPKS